MEPQIKMAFDSIYEAILFVGKANLGFETGADLVSVTEQILNSTQHTSKRASKKGN